MEELFIYLIYGFIFLSVLIAFANLLGYVIVNIVGPLTLAAVHGVVVLVKTETVQRLFVLAIGVPATITEVILIRYNRQIKQLESRNKEAVSKYHEMYSRVFTPVDDDLWQDYCSKLPFKTSPSEQRLHRLAYKWSRTLASWETSLVVCLELIRQNFDTRRPKR